MSIYIYVFYIFKLYWYIYTYYIYLFEAFSLEPTAKLQSQTNCQASVFGTIDESIQI